MPIFPGRGGRSVRVSGVLVSVLAVVVVAGTATLYVDYQRKITRATSGSVATDARATSARPADGPPGRRHRKDGGKVVSLWIGDGYTAGAGARSPRTGEACVAAAELGWKCELDAERGTGFLSDGSAFSPSYAALPDRIDRLPANEPDVVVVDAGRNDLGVFAGPAIEQTMADYIAALRAKYPHATLIQIVPWTLGQKGPTPEIESTVTRLMREYDGYVVDPYADGWAGEGKTDRRPLRGGAGILNQAGHELVGHELAHAIRGLHLPVPTHPR